MGRHRRNSLLAILLGFVTAAAAPSAPDERDPPPSQKMAREEVDAAMAEAGLAPVRVHEFLPEQFFVEYETIR